MSAFTPKLNIKLIQETEQFIDESFNNVILDIDNKLVGVAHLSSGAHWDVWNSASTYNVNDVVRWPNLLSHQYAKCIASGTSNTNSPTSNVTGSMVNDGSVTWLICSLTDSSGSNNGISIWQGTKSYTRNDTVLHSSVLYRCKISHISSASFSSDINNWQEIFSSVRLWESSALYLLNDTVLYDGYLYKCIVQHTSGATFSTSNWQRVCDLLYLTDWESNKKYDQNQLVNIDGIVYKCLIPHTSSSSSDLDAFNWVPICATICVWSPNSFYNSSVIVIHNNNLYVCNISHVSTSSFPPITSGYWTLLNKEFSFIPDWNPSVDYYVNSVVKYDNNLYRAVNTHNALQFSDTNWELITDNINIWNSNSLYVVGQIVLHDNKLYRCIVSNSDNIFTVSNWQKIACGSLETWTSNKDYSVGDIVINANKIYQCNTVHTSSSSFNTDASNWTEVSACITRIPNWAVSTEYVVGDLVAHDAKIYRCITAHTSDATQWDNAEEANWEELSPTINEITTWSVSTDYAIGQLVIHDNKLYRCNTAHTSDSTSFNTDIAYWDEIGDSGIDSWKTGELYQQGSMVVYNDKIYVCDTAHTSANPFDFTKWHEVSSTTIEDWQSNTEYVENQPIEYNDTLFRANKDFTSGTTVSDDDSNMDFVYANLSTWQSGVYYRQGAIVIDSDDKIYKCKQSHTSSSANRDTNWEELSKTLVEEYAQNKNYAEGAPVLYNGKLYRANTDVTNSTATLDPNKWDNIVGSGIEQWQPSTDYSVGNVVVNNNQIYICTTAHTSDSTAFNTDIANWGLLDTKWKSENWSANTLYTANEVVLYDNRLFRCVSTHTSAVDFATDANYWLAIGSRLEVWKQNVYYKVEDVIINNNKLYRCIVEHTSTTTFDGTKWDEISPAIIELWQTSTDYKVGDIVVKDGQLFRCKTLHTSDSSDFYTDIANWDVLDTKWQAKDWVTNTYYLEDEVVLYNNTPYKCITAHISLGTFELDKADWEPLSANIRQWVSGTTYKVGDTVIYNGDIWKCNTDTTSNGFDKPKWDKIDKCNIDIWHGAPDNDILALLHFDTSYCPEYNEYGNDFTRSSTGVFNVVGGKFNNCLSVVGSTASMNSPQYTFDNGEVYTVEFWMLYDDSPIHWSDNSGVAIGNIGQVIAQVYSVYHFVNTPYGYTPINFNIGVWNHMAYVITPTDFTAYVNGIQEFTITRPNSLPISISIGGANSPASAIDELCITKGAKYTANFTPQTKPFTNPNFEGYKKDDLVVYNNKIYQALVDNNDIEFAPSKWVEVSSANTPLWESSIYYAVGDIVIYGNQTYRCTTAHTSNTFLGDIVKWQPLDTNWLVNDWEANKLYLENQVVSYDDGLWKCLYTHESASGDSPADSVLYTSLTNVIDVNDTTIIPYSETIDLGSVKKVTDFTYNEVTSGMSFTYTIETSEDNIIFTPWNNTKTNARYVKLTVDSVNIATGATSPNAYLDNFTVVGESDNWEKISSGSTNISLATTSAINAMFI